VLFKLARGAALNRPMPGVVRARCQLVDDQFAVALQEHLDGQQSDEIEVFGHVAGKLARRFGHILRHNRRRYG